MTDDNEAPMVIEGQQYRVHCHMRYTRSITVAALIGGIDFKP